MKRYIAKDIFIWTSNKIIFHCHGGRRAIILQLDRYGNRYFSKFI